MRRAGWRLAERFGGRRLGRVLCGVEGLTAPGVQRVAKRVSPRLARVNPGLAKVRPEWAVDRITVRRRGLEWELDLRDNLQAVLYYAGRYEPGLSRFFRCELQRGDTFVDVGANIGVHALPAAAQLQRLGGGRVVAFEPAADTREKLRIGATRNNLTELIEIVPLALGDQPGSVELRADPRYDLADTGVRSVHGDGTVVEQIDVVRLDDWAGRLDRLDLLKLDIEGAEPAALAGAAETLRRLRPRAIVVEEKHTSVRAQLAELGYRPSGRPLDHNTCFRPTD